MSHVQKEKDQKNSSKLLPLTQSFVLWGIPLWKGDSHGEDFTDGGSPPQLYFTQHMSYNLFQM